MASESSVLNASLSVESCNDLLAIQRETQDFKTFGEAANPDQDLNMTRYALDKP